MSGTLQRDNDTFYMITKGDPVARNASRQLILFRSELWLEMIRSELKEMSVCSIKSNQWIFMD